jgi:hypothetical protein
LESYEKVIYKEWNQIERLFNRLKNCRRVATRYEKRARNYLAMLHLAGHDTTNISVDIACVSKGEVSNEMTERIALGRFVLGVVKRVMGKSSPRRSQLDSGFVERGTLQLKRLHRAAVIDLFGWSAAFSGKSEPKPAPKERREPFKLARHYQALLDSGKFENRAALARHLGVSRARVTQVLKRLNATAAGRSDG